MGEILAQRANTAISSRKPTVLYSKDTEFYEADHFFPPQVKRETKTTSKSIVAIRDDDWKSLVNSITYLFHKKQLQKLELDILNEKVRNVRASKKGAFIVECYKESILKKGIEDFYCIFLLIIYLSDLFESVPKW